MKTITAEQFKKQYGDNNGFTPPSGRPSIGQVIGNSFKAGVDQVKTGFAQTDPTNPKNSVGSFFKGIGNIGSGAISAAFSPLAPALEPTVGAGVNFAADKISNIPAIQKFSNTGAGQAIASGAQDVANYANIAGVVGGALEVPKVGTAITDTAKAGVRSVGEVGNKVLQPVKTAAKDIIPTSERIVNHQISQALDLTPGDLRNIHASTGNDVGRFMADNNLIGHNVEATKGLVNDFYKQNYAEVRTEIAKVDTVYKRSQVKGYYDGLKEINSQIKDIPGLTKDAVEVQNLMNKKELSLTDVQRVKELMDEHFNLYKVTGDVKEGATKQGLTNIRKDLQTFIEKQVKEKTGGDIKAMNNNVSTGRSIVDAIDTRASRGLTRANVSLSDLSLFGGGSIAGGPLVGAALVFGKRILQSPSIQLRIAKFLDGLSDAKKAAIQTKLIAGEVPTELKPVVPKSWFTKAKEAYQNSSMSDEGGFVQNPFAPQVAETFQRLQAQKLKLLAQGYKETSPAVRNIIKSMKRLENEQSR